MTETADRRLTKRPRQQLVGIEQEATEEKHGKDRRYRRAMEAHKQRSQGRLERARRRARASHLSGGPAVRHWHAEYVDGLQRMAGKLGIMTRLHGVDDILLADAKHPQDRKRICIRLAQEQAKLAGVTNAQWACMTRRQRAAAVALAQVGGREVPERPRREVSK